MQTSADVAPSAVLLMADRTRNGQLVYSEDARMWEIEEALLLPAADAVRIPGTQSLDETLIKAIKGIENAAAAAAAAAKEKSQ